MKAGDVKPDPGSGVDEATEKIVEGEKEREGEPVGRENAKESAAEKGAERLTRGGAEARVTPLTMRNRSTPSWP